MSLSMNPHEGLQAEQAVLGSVFCDNAVMDDICDMLEPRDFDYVAHELIWKGMQYQYRHNKPIDLITIVEMLKRYDRLDDIGGVTYISELTQAVPSYGRAKIYAEIVRDRAYRKRGVQAASEIMRLAEDGSIEMDAYFEQVERAALSVRPQASGNMKSIAEVRQEYFDYLAQKDDFIFTGFKQFDDWMGGIGRGWLYILAARPSVGKTAKVLQMAQGIASQGKGEVIIWSQEMKRPQLLNRIMASVTGINGNRIRKKEFDASELKRITEAYDKIEQLPLHIEDAKNVTIDEVRATARQIKRKHGELAAIIVDYLTIMKINQQKGETRSQAVGYVTRTAKQIALEMNCPFIMLAQLSRDGKEEPKLEHLRDSGEIEQDADVVEFLWHNPEETSRDGTVIQSIIAKGRDVGVNQFKYLFKKWVQRYEDYH